MDRSLGRGGACSVRRLAHTPPADFSSGDTGGDDAGGAAAGEALPHTPADAAAARPHLGSVRAEGGPTHTHTPPAEEPQ